MYNSSCFLIAEEYFMVWMNHSLLNHLPIERHLGYFQFGASMNKAAINICVQVLV